MSKKARRRPSWKHKNPAYRFNYFVLGGRRVWIAKRKVTAKKRQLKDDWSIEYTQETTHLYADDLLEEINKQLIEEIVKECKSGDRFYQDTLQKFPLLGESVYRDCTELPQEHTDNGTKWRWKIDPSRRPHFFPIR